MTRIKRSELYRLVWEEPRRLLAPKYGISDVGLGKICRRHDIPMPPRGYWAKKLAGKKVKARKLPHPNDDEIIEFLIEPPKELPSGPAPAVDDYPYTGLQAEVLRRLAVESLPEAQISIRETLKDSHSVVAATRRYLHTWGKEGGPRYDRTIRINVTSTLRRRVLLFLDALLKGLIERGFEVIGPTTVRLFYSDVCFTIRELSDRTKQTNEVGGVTYDFEPNGRLIFEIAGPAAAGRNNWRDTATKSLESQISQVVTGLTLHAAYHHESDVEFAHWEREIAAKKARQAEDELRARRDKLRLTELNDWATKWTESRAIRRFLAAAEKQYARGELDWETATPFSEWLQWAKQQSKALDPFAKPLATRYPLSLDGDDCPPGAPVSDSLQR